MSNGSKDVKRVMPSYPNRITPVEPLALQVVRVPGLRMTQVIQLFWKLLGEWLEHRSPSSCHSHQKTLEALWLKLPLVLPKNGSNSIVIRLW